MRKGIHIIPIILILVFILVMAGKQLVADFSYSMARKDGRDPNKAIRHLENCILIDEKNPSFHFTMGREFLRKGLVKTAKRYEQSRWLRESIYEFRKAIDLKPSSGDYHFHLGLSYASLGYPPPFYWSIIQNSFDRTATLNSTNVLHLYTIGIYYFNEYERLRKIGLNAGETNIANYKNHMEISKDNYQFFFRKLLDVDEEYLTKILEKCFSVTQKYHDLKSVIRDNPSDHAVLARFLDGKGMWEDAEREYRNAINLEPANSIHYSRFAHALCRRRYYEEAIDWWQKQKLIDPEDGTPYLFSADSFIKLKRFDDALQELRDVTTLYPENISYRVKLIRTLLVTHQVDAAIDEYRKVAEKNQHFSKSMYDKIHQYQKKGNYPKAVTIINEALTSALNR